MSTGAAVSEHVIRLRLALLMALIGAIGGMVAGSAIEWGSLPLPASDRAELTQYTEGYVLARVGLCQHTIRGLRPRCALFADLTATRVGRALLLPRAQRIAVVWPAAGAITLALLAWILLTWRARRLLALDAHAPRDLWGDDAPR
ncbi:hypothetical protein [Metallibacterium sp.]|uniref:hypothetical protein n=1 Tax=Metallibacterium sp. TaxID=2940281 RepID=UPI0026272558|nr:hypothetical protein [Metallibacterium sp.]